jgi:hypothetical protein
MLRITEISGNRSPVTLTLEGRIVSEWVRLLDREARRVLNQKRPLRLDFTDVYYVDRDGVRLVHRLESMGVELANRPLWIRELLQETTPDLGSRP